MSAHELAATPAARFPFLPSRQQLPLVATVLVFVAMYVAAGLMYDNFFSTQVFINLFRGNAVLGLVAIGMTFVILSSGIDLSVGTAIGCVTIFVATRIELHHWHPVLAILVAVLGTTAIGALQGFLIHRFELQPFLVTLGGLFFYRGLGLIISERDVSIKHSFYQHLRDFSLSLGPVTLTLPAILFLALFAVAAFIAAKRPAGRTVYAVGGNEQSALLMGLPVASTKIGVYAFSGFCAALAGIASTIDKTSGLANTGDGMELDAIAAVVIGGTLLTGGVGGPIGTLLGVLIFGVIKTVIQFQGDLNSAWNQIIPGVLLLAFILLQTLLQPKEDHA